MEAAIDDGRATRRATSKPRCPIRPCSRTAPTEVQALVAELDGARAEVERLFARWQELEAIPEG